MNDLEIRQQIIDELEFDPRLNVTGIGVAFEHGVATLTGHVASYYERLAALKAVKRLKAVHAARRPLRHRRADPALLVAQRLPGGLPAQIGSR